MNILLSDDHQLFIDGMRLILGKLDDFVSVTESNTAEQAIQILESGENFDLILIDLSMPGMNGLSILQRMYARKTWLPLVVISAEEDIHTIKAVLDAGALGFIPKSHNSQQMIGALHAVLKGDIYIPVDIEKELNKLVARRNTPGDAAIHAVKGNDITPRQNDVLQLLAKGYSNKQIATSLFLTEHTVKAHVSALFNSLHAKNRTECVQNAQKQGLVTNH